MICHCGKKIEQAMTTYGYTIINTLVTDIDPDKKNAMNRINAADSGARK
jgi:hypothetical protein